MSETVKCEKCGEELGIAPFAGQMIVKCTNKECENGKDRKEEPEVSVPAVP